jgi:hypothetical protein
LIASRTSTGEGPWVGLLRLGQALISVTVPAGLEGEVWNKIVDPTSDAEAHPVPGPVPPSP